MRELFNKIQEHSEWKKANQVLEQKRQAAINYLGEKWILHPINHQQKKGKK